MTTPLPGQGSTTWYPWAQQVDAEARGAAQTSANLSDLASPSTARTNLGATQLTVNGTFAPTYDLDTTPVTPADIGAQPADADLTAVAGLDSSTAGAIASDGSGWIKKTYAQLKTALGLTKADVGLGNVDNTSDAAKLAKAAGLALILGS